MGYLICFIVFVLSFLVLKTFLNRRSIMNRRQLLIKLLLVSVLVTSLVTGCDKEDPNGPGPDITTGNFEDLVATWTFRSVTVNDHPGDLSYVLDWVSGADEAGFRILADGSYIYAENDSQYGYDVWMEWGTIKVDDDSFTIEKTEDFDGPIQPPEKVNGKWSVSGNTLTMDVVDGSNTYCFKATK
jgi:hypothetical protein